MRADLRLGQIWKISVKVVSIIVCSRNRAECLRKCLTALAAVRSPVGVQTELIVVDNGSTDRTQEVISDSRSCIKNVHLITLFESRKGKSNALNVAVNAASGDIILLTDDDVEPPVDWIERMIEPILNNQADAVAGGVRLADYLHDTWLTQEHKSWLATTEYMPKNTSTFPLIGANTALSRKVFQKVPQFDPEVGPGQTGHSEDTLFWLQVREAGFKIIARFDIEVTHHVELERTTPTAFRHMSEKRGEFAAYVDYHWNHIDRKHPYLALAHAWLKLNIERCISFIRNESNKVSIRELDALEQYHFRRRLLVEKKRPRTYSKRHGLHRKDFVAVKNRSNNLLEV